MIFLTVLLLFLFVVSLFIRLYVSIMYTYDNQEQELLIALSLYHFPIVEKKLPLIMDKTDESIFQDLVKSDSLKDHLDFLANVVKQMTNILRRLRLHQFNWSTNIGTGEAASTGIAAGVLWGCKSSLVALLTKPMNIIQPADIHVHPDFEGEVLQTNIDCQVSIKLSQAIIALFNLRKLFK